jgi:hypothetical protein
MHQNSAVRTDAGRASSPVRSAERPVRSTAADGTAPPAVALLVAPALLAVCFR